MLKRRWLMIGSIIAGIGLGTWGLTRYVPPPEGPNIGDSAPDFRVIRLNGGDSVGLRTSYTGHVTLINLWATYCVPCRKEMPAMQRLYDKFASRGFRVAAVSLDDGDSAPVLDFAKSLNLTFDILQDRSNLSLQAFQGMGLPTSVLIDAKGRIIYTTIGMEEWDSPENIARVEALLPAKD